MVTSPQWFNAFLATFIKYFDSRKGVALRTYTATTKKDIYMLDGDEVAHLKSITAKGEATSGSMAAHLISTAKISSLARYCQPC